MAKKLVETFAPADPLAAKTLAIEEALAELQAIDLTAIVDVVDLLPELDSSQWLSQRLKAAYVSLKRARGILLDATA